MSVPLTQPGPPGPAGPLVQCSTACPELGGNAIDVHALVSLADVWVEFRTRLLVAVETFELSTSDPIDKRIIDTIRSATGTYDTVLRSICLPLDHDTWRGE